MFLHSLSWIQVYVLVTANLTIAIIAVVYNKNFTPGGKSAAGDLLAVVRLSISTLGLQYLVAS